MIDLSLNRNVYYASRRLEVGWTETGGKSRLTTGTGFLVVRTDPPPNRVFLVTNRHVIDPVYRSEKYRGLVASVDSVAIIGFEGEIDGGNPNQTIKVDGVKPRTSDDWAEDVAVMEVTNSPVMVNGSNSVNRAWNFDMLASKEEFGDAVRVGDLVVSIGFPRFGEYQTVRPVLTTGIIATDPVFPAPHRKFDKSRIVLSDSFSRSGMSGSPVVAVQRGLKLGNGLSGPPHRDMRVVGVNAGHLRAEDGDTMGLAHFVRSDVVRSLIDEFY